MNEKLTTEKEVYEAPRLDVIEVETVQNVLGGSTEEVTPAPW